MSRAAPFLLAATALLIAACQKPAWISAGPLQIAPRRLEIGRTQVGHPVRGRIAITNTGSAPLRARLVARGPYAVMSEIELAAGERQEVEIEFTPQSTGAHWSELQVHTDQASAAIELRGSAIAGEACSNGHCPRAERP